MRCLIVLSLLALSLAACSDDTVVVAKDLGTKKDIGAAKDFPTGTDAAPCPATKPTVGGACQLPPTKDCLFTDPSSVPGCDGGSLCKTIKTHCTCKSNVWECVVEADAGA